MSKIKYMQLNRFEREDMKTNVISINVLKTWLPKM